MKPPKPRKNYKNRTQPKSKSTVMSQKIANRFSLSHTGKPKKPAGKLQKKLASFLLKNNNKVQVSITVLIIAYAIFCIFFNFKLILLIPIVSLTVHYWTRIKIYFRYPKLAIWYIKVFILFRDYYQDRRNLYQQGTLLFHFTTKKTTRDGIVFAPTNLPKSYNFNNGNQAIIWGQSEKLRDLKFNTLQENQIFFNKEYIKHLNQDWIKKHSKITPSDKNNPRKYSNKW